ncbi:hypothetical protein [Ekhidna sp.]|uniref:hypothetical protein n=1 Tax=Ekhidna sp. TaxID=2608089 RepID=UPI003BAC6605
MRVKLLLLHITIVFINSCDDERLTLADLDGTYEGNFIRSSPYAKYAPAQVTLTFANGQFQGANEKTKYPAICNGTYEVEGDKVEFINACIWTAEFDWSLILSGEFYIEFEANTLTLQRKNGDITDLYQLKRK